MTTDRHSHNNSTGFYGFIAVVAIALLLVGAPKAAGYLDAIASENAQLRARNAQLEAEKSLLEAEIRGLERGASLSN